MTPVESRIAENYRATLSRIESACTRSGRPGSSVRLVAVTKYAEIGWIQTLVALGAQDLGESRPQQLLERVPLISDSVRWHLIGPLQRNKARRVLRRADWIHSVDSLRLLTTIDRLAADTNRQPQILLEVNISGESAKQGFSPEQLEADWEMVLSCPHVNLAGLMTMAPDSQDPEQARPVFRGLRELRDRLAERSALSLPELSMGMSGDFGIAIEEGATLVRIGSSLFTGLRPDGKVDATHD